MKKIYLVLALLFIAFTGIFAQETTDKTQTSGETETTKVVNNNGMPQAGDIAVGLDLSPFMTYLGNAFNGATKNSFGGNFLGNKNTLLLKYFLTKQSAVRASFTFETGNLDTSRYVQDDAAILANPLSNAQVIDRMDTLKRNFGLNLGYEMHRGRGKLKGIFGAEVGFLKKSSSYTYTYGNAITNLNQNPTTTDFGNNIKGTNRVISSDNGGSFGIDADLFLGVEYFVKPNISLGSEVSWGVTHLSTKQGSDVEQYWNGAEVKEMTKLTSAGSNSFISGMQNPKVLFYMMFHF